MDEIFEIESLEDLEAFLASKSQVSARESLVKMFHRFASYKNAEEWNKAVRLCESLAIVGWGKYESVEAIRDQALNGNPYTMFQNAKLEQRFVSTQWSKRKAGYTIDPGFAMYYASPDVPEKPTIACEHYQVEECIQDIKLATQRNWIAKCPVRVYRMVSNCYPESEEFAADVDENLKAALDEQMSTSDYGRAINRIYLRYSLSWGDRGSKKNLVILDEEGRISTPELYKRLCQMYSKKEIEENGYYLRQRYEYGNFRAATGEMGVEISFPKEFSMQSTASQKREFAVHLITALDGAIDRIKKRKVKYDFEQMRNDLLRVVEAWAR